MRVNFRIPLFLLLFLFAFNGMVFSQETPIVTIISATYGLKKYYRTTAIYRCQTLPGLTATRSCGLRMHGRLQSFSSRLAARNTRLQGMVTARLCWLWCRTVASSRNSWQTCTSCNRLVTQKVRNIKTGLFKHEASFNAPSNLKFMKIH